MKETIYAMWLKDLEGMTLRKGHTFFSHYQSFEKIFNTDPKDLNVLLAENLRGNDNKWIKREVFKRHKERLFDYEKEYNNLPKGYHILSQADLGFPKGLKELHDCPVTLYARSERSDLQEDLSNLIPEFSIGIVGSRRCTLYGKDMAKMLAKDLADKGVNIVSGLAYGIDVAAHEGALLSGGSTTAVLGGGVANCYPKRHNKIFEEIIKTNCVLSEEPFHTQVEPYMFPKRNRIISGLSRGVVIVEAAAKSGSLITADFALEQGRDVYAVPGRVLDPKAAGTNGLIKQGAKLVFNYEDVLNEYTNLYKQISNKSEKIEKKLEEKEKIVYSCISYEPIHEESLVKSIFKEIEKCTAMEEYTLMYSEKELKTLAAINESDIILCLLTLELKGLIVKKSSCYYARSEV